MTEIVFEEFKKKSQAEFATQLAEAESVNFDVALKNASDQFNKLVSEGLQTPDQFFFEVFEEKSGNSIGFVWLGIQQRLLRKVVSINEITIKAPYRNKGFGRALMNCVEQEAKKVKANRVRLHVFQRNKVAYNMYLNLGYVPTSIDMVKLI